MNYLSKDLARVQLWLHYEDCLLTSCNLNIQVAPYKRIRKVAFVASIPKNPSGKILRKDLIKLATSKL